MRPFRNKNSVGALFLLVVIAGCGSPSPVADKSGSTAKTSETSASPPTTAATATPVKATEVAKPADPTAPRSTSHEPAKSPVAEPVAKPAPPAASAELADTRQLAKVLDLGKLPMPEGATIGQQSATRLQVGVPLAVPSAVDFYLGKLDALGWKRAGPKTAETSTDSFAQVSLGKDGYRLTLTAMSGKPKEASVSIEHVGNLDTRTIPRVDGAEDQYSDPSSLLYFTPAKVDEATATMRRLLTADGWQEYDQAFSQKAVRPDASDLLFRKKAYSLSVAISKPATQPDKSAVQYYVRTLAHDLPAPPDARRVEIEDSRWILMCEVPRNLDAVADYYRTAMQEIGFPSKPHETRFDKALSLSFESEGHDLVLVSLKAVDQQTTKVKLEGYCAAFREAMKKAEVAEKAKREAREKEEAQAKAERTKAFQEASKREDDMIEGAVGNVLSEAVKPTKQTELSRKIQAEVKSELEKALQGVGAKDLDDEPEKKPEK